MDVSIIIVNYNTTQLLMNAIDSVFAKTEDIEYEIIVVDNNSPDNPKNILFERYGDKIIYLSLSENIGFGRANNEAYKITFMYAEEIELDYRLQKAGYKLYSIPDALVLYLEGRSISDNNEKLLRKFNMHSLYLQKTHNTISIMLINVLSILI